MIRINADDATLNRLLGYCRPLVQYLRFLALGGAMTAAYFRECTRRRSPYSCASVLARFMRCEWGMPLELLHADITDPILRVYYEILNELGFGFLEDVYQTAMVIALRAVGLDVQQHVPIRVWFRGIQVGQFYADIVVNHLVLIELKTGGTIELRYEAQTLNYLRASDLEVGLILLFGPQAKTRRLVYEASRKARPVAGVPECSDSGGSKPIAPLRPENK